MEPKKLNLSVKILMVFSLIAIIGSLPFVNYKGIDRNLQKPFPLSKKSIKQKKEIDLKEAIDLGLKEAQKWSNFAELVEVSSADDGDNAVGIRGVDGSRCSWNLFFVDKKVSKYYYIKIINNTVISQREAQGYPYGPIRLTSLKINSKEALEIAQSYRELKPGQGWAIGYHYRLTQPKDFPIITVYGFSSEGDFSYVEINAENGQVVFSQKKVYNQDGRSLWVNY